MKINIRIYKTNHRKNPDVAVKKIKKLKIEEIEEKTFTNDKFKIEILHDNYLTRLN